MSAPKPKGQSAIEYLTTYGWMLLVIAIVGGAIFTTVSNQGQIKSTSGLANADVRVEEFGVTEQGFQAELRGSSSDQIRNLNFTLIDPEAGETVSQETTAVPVGDTQTVTLSNVTESETSNTYNVKIEYDTGGLENLEETGSITGQIKIDKPEPTTYQLLTTKTYTFTGSKETIDLEKDFSEPVDEIKIVEMHGADGSNNGDDARYGGSGGFIANASADVSSYSQLEIWVGETTEGTSGGWGKSNGGSGGTYTFNLGGGGGGSTELWLDGTTFLAAADAGGGAGGASAAGGGARGGSGGGSGSREGQDAQGTGFGGNGGTSSENGSIGGQELGIASLDANGNMTTGGSDEGSGKIILEYYSED